MLTIIHGCRRAPKNVLHRPSTSVYYCQRKPKNSKNGVGLGTRLEGGREGGREVRGIAYKIGDAVYDLLFHLQDVILSEPQTQSSLELECAGSTDLEIDWGDVAANNTSSGESDGIDFGESEIDFSADAVVDLSVITIEDSGEGGEGESDTGENDTKRGETLGPLDSNRKGEPTGLKPLMSSRAHEPPKAAKERQTQHVCTSRSSSPSHIPNVYLILQEAIT